MFEIKFQQEDPKARPELILRYPLAEDVDDYNAYKTAIREQRDAERKGARLLEARLTEHAGLDKRLPHPFTSDVSHTGSKADAMSSRSNPRRPNVLDGSTDDEEDQKRTASLSFTSSFFTRLTRPYSRQKRTLDGSADELSDSEDRSMPPSGVIDQSIPFKIPVGTMFTPIDWNPGAVVERDTSTESVEPLDDLRNTRLSLYQDEELFRFTASQSPICHRACFEIARRARPHPDNAAAYLHAQRMVYDDLGFPEYVDKLVG
jgi:hypothetical protein